MGQAALGTKRICGNCGSRFYDLNKAQIICPKCGYEEKASAVEDHVIDLPVKEEKAEKAVMVDDETGIDLSEFDTEIDPTTGMPKGLDAVESLDDADNEIESLSELEDREIHERQVGHDDTVEEEELIENMKDGGLIIDDIPEEEARA